jgi:hypothetical protein
LEYYLRLDNELFKNCFIMNFLSYFKMLGLGILGGTLPLATYVIIEHSSTTLSEQVLDGNRFARQVSMSGVCLLYTSPSPRD